MMKKTEKQLLPKPRRFFLRRLIEALRDAPEKKPQPRQDRETTRKEQELERALDEAIRSDP
jgi:hypothetical protein